MLRSVKYGLYGAVLAGLVAAPVVWNSVDKTVHLSVDGHTQSVQTTASDVGQVLAGKGYRVGQHDLVAPAVASPVHNGMQVVLRHGRLIRLNVDGQRADVWTTAPTVQAALAQLGYTADAYVSVSRSRRLPLSPTSIAIRTPQTVTVVHDGRRDQVSTTDATVGQLLADLDIVVGPEDLLSAASTAPLTDGEVVTLQRVTRISVVKLAPIKYKTTRKQDRGLVVGKTKILTHGKNGTAKLTYSDIYVDGKLDAHALLSTVTTQTPTTQIVAVGAKPLPKTAGSGAAGVPNAPDPSPGTAKAIAKQLLAARGWGDDQYSCLVTLWNHESGWRVTAANPSGAYGIPQALPGSKMASAGPDWQHNATTQITWGLGYIAARYHDPCEAWSTWQAHGGWY